MNKKLILITFILLLTVTISLLTLSYFWFNQEVDFDIDPVEMGAVPLNLMLDIDIVSSQPSYMGQTGKDGGLDTPYSIDFDVEMTCSDSEQYNQNLRLNIRELDIKMWNYIAPEGENPAQNYYYLTEEQIADNFTWRIIYSEDIYKPDSEGYMYKTDGTRVAYLSFSSGDTVQYTLRMIYLGELKYELWQQARYNEYDEFAFCAPDFMDATFRFSMDFELNTAEQNFNDMLAFEIKDTEFDHNKTGSSIANTHIFTYEPQIVPYVGESGEDKAVCAYIDGVTIVKADNETINLETEDIANNFTLRFTENNFKKRPSGEAGYINYMFENYGQSTVWMSMAQNILAEMQVEVICQDEEDYYSMLLGLAGYPQTTFAYATSEYSGATVYFDINFDMVDIPSMPTVYEFGSTHTMGRINSSYDGKDGTSEANTYSFNNNITWTPTVSNKVKLTITGVTILRTDGVTQTLTSNQINANFSPKVVYGGHTWLHYGGILPSHKYFMSRETSPGVWGDFLELDANTAHNVNMIIAFSSGSSFAYTASQYVNAIFCFDVKIEVIDFY